jgi:hypothetical protein
VPTELLLTVATVSIGFAGLAALSQLVVGLAGVRWRPEMTTALWLMTEWSVGTLAFSLLPLVLLQFKLEIGTVTSICSVLLGCYFLAIIGLALARDLRLRRSGSRPPVGIMSTFGPLAALIGVGLVLNGLSILPGNRSAWYVSGVFSALMYAALPLWHLMSLLSERS